VTRRGKRLIWSLILVPACLYLAICAIMFFAQTHLLLPVAQVGPSGPLPPAAERLETAAASGERLRGLHIPPARPGGERLLILGFGGNAWNADAMATLLADLYPGADIVTFHYRGYPPSEGSPGAAAMQADALSIFDFARGHYPSRRTLAVGFSIGSGVAASLAAHRPLDGLILVTAFDSLGRVAAAQFPWLPVRLLFRNNLDPAEDLAGSRVPVALVSAGGDRLVLPARTQALRGAIPNLVFDRTIAGADHNDIYRNPAFAPAMREALQSLLAGSR
jgi:pimeloyl-ACP methyl ester carboxylesterase